MDLQVQDNQQPSGNLREVLTVLFRHWWKMAAVFWGVVLTVTVVTMLMPPVYEAKSLLLVRFGREYTYRPEASDKIPVVMFNAEEAINSEIRILSSHDLIEKVITTVTPEQFNGPFHNPYSGLTPLDAAIQQFTKKLTVEADKKSNVIEVSLRGKDPQMLARAVNLLVAYFTEKHIQVYNAPQSPFLEKQLQSYERKLSQSENGLKGFKKDNRVYSLDEQRSLLLKQRTEMDTVLKSTLHRIDELASKLSSQRGQLKSVASDKDRYTLTDRDRIVVEARAKLLALQLKEQELLEKYKEGSRLVTNVRGEIRLVNEFLAQQEQEIAGKVKTANAVYQSVEKDLLTTEAELGSQRAKAATLKQQLAQLDGEIQSLDLKENHLLGLKREVAINEKNYRTFVDRLEESRISDDMNRQKMANVSVIQSAAVPVQPIRPNKGLNIALGVLFGMFSAIATALVSEYASQVFSTPEAVERRLGLPVLASITHK